MTDGIATDFNDDHLLNLVGGVDFNVLVGQVTAPGQSSRCSGVEVDRDLNLVLGKKLLELVLIDEHLLAVLNQDQVTKTNGQVVGVDLGLGLADCLDNPAPVILFAKEHCLNQIGADNFGRPGWLPWC